MTLLYTVAQPCQLRHTTARSSALLLSGESHHRLCHIWI